MKCLDEYIDCLNNDEGFFKIFLKRICYVKVVFEWCLEINELNYLNLFIDLWDIIKIIVFILKECLILEWIIEF